MIASGSKNCVLKLLAFILLIAALAACSQAQPQSVPPQTFDTGVDSEAWAVIPAGEFLMGAHNAETLVDYDYEMMLTDVTNAQFASYLNQALASSKVKLSDDADLGKIVLGYYPGDEFHGFKHEVEITAGDWLYLTVGDPGLRLDFDGSQFSAKAGYENHPAVMVTWFAAKAYCEFYGWRLPNEIEWEKAARGSDGRAYPWGNEIARENANYYSSHDVFEKITGALGDTTPVGFYNGQTYAGYTTLDSRSPYGLFDMAGNVWQWVANIYEGTHYRYLRGGSKMDYEYNLRVWTRNSAGPDYFSPSIGFRCAR
jgi:formylglycine-generating enzyme